MWLKRRRMFRIDAESGLPQVDSADRGTGDRVRAAGRGGESLNGRELSYALSAHRPAGRGVVGDARAQRVPAADRVGAGGRGRDIKARSEPGLCAIAAGRRRVGAQARCKEKEAGDGSRAATSVSDSFRGNPAHTRTGGRAGAGPVGRAGRLRDQLSLAVAIVSAG